jgi:hypothetical protein
MISGLHKINPLLPDKINNPVLLLQPARPGSIRRVAQRFRPASNLERVAQDAFIHFKEA